MADDDIMGGIGDAIRSARGWLGDNAYGRYKDSDPAPLLKRNEDQVKSRAAGMSKSMTSKTAPAAADVKTAAPKVAVKVMPAKGGKK